MFLIYPYVNKNTMLSSSSVSVCTRKETIPPAKMDAEKSIRRPVGQQGRAGRINHFDSIPPRDNAREEIRSKEEREREREKKKKKNTHMSFPTFFGKVSCASSPRLVLIRFRLLIHFICFCLFLLYLLIYFYLPTSILFC